jgi:cell division protein FtsN
MPHDYATQQKKHAGALWKKKETNSIRFFLISGFSIILIIGGIIGFYFLKKTPHQEEKLSTIHHKNQLSSKKKIAYPNKMIKIIPPTKEKVKLLSSINNYEIPFYQTHQEMMNKTVDIPLKDLELPHQNYHYFMPCGSFKRKKQAYRLKARIALVGYYSSIIEIKTQTRIWFRVELGMFTSKREAESIRHKLQDNQIIHCKIWRKKK